MADLRDSVPTASRARRIKVVNLLTRFSPGGGIPKVVRELVARADTASIDHHVCLVRRLRRTDYDDLLERATFHSLELPDGGKLQRLASAAVGNIRFARLLERLDPDVVHLHTGTSVMGLLPRVSTGRKAAWLMDFHEPLEVRHSRLTTGTVYTMVRRLGFSGVTHSTAVTQRIEEQLGGRVLLRMIPLGVDLRQFVQRREDDRQQWRQSNGFDPDRPLVVSVGRIAPMKGSDKLVEIARAVLSKRPEVQFAFIGGGPSKAELMQRVAQLGLDRQVRFMGFVEDLRSALAASDIYLTASTYEGFGIAVLEAMSSGLPVVGTRIDGLLDLIQPGHTGVLVDPGNLTGYVDSVLALVQDASLRSRLGANARERAVTNFDISNTVASYESLYRELARSSRVTEPCPS